MPNSVLNARGFKKRKKVDNKDKKIVFFYVGFSIAFILDRASKQIILSVIPENSHIEIFRFFRITNIRNSGICFGLFDNPIYLPIFIFTSLIAIGFIISYVYKKRSELPLLSLFSFGIIAGGVLGNLIDRIIFYGVIDFIDFRIWPVFNLADSFIVLGVLTLVMIYWRQKDASCMF
ncbi:MAG: signal peptidase II [Candidatus Omnitrophica bacterium]|nr:signal peptidase II [Candidatus Omnitrophota bacterium]MCM8816122.1 signal peptidase II [Candidatus Omnitrophota bacterium]